MGEYDHPDTIGVQTKRRLEISADKADLHLSIQGKSLLMSTAAQKKAQEIVQLVNALEPFGIKEENFFLDGVETESEKGVLGQTTAAKYRIRIRCNDLHRLKDILGVVTNQQNTRLDRMTWRFAKNEALRNELLEACIRDSKQQAERVASTLGVTLIGVYSFMSQFSQYEDNTDEDASQFRGMMSDRLICCGKPEPLELGFSLTRREWLEVMVNAEYRVSELAKK